ncbi:uncharacterized protein N7515_000769 [Penicillium bovifimosum]|uniref:Uncharacterized protein n=1 Tax=Penicillium bovifimosum TaxID=126998 RepID=A0A9W9HI11_9EURO|nr:uncharacterized protein N7515_000769 [Penicillium bovifimosum]KAJ5146205.1 hypothetical protein N7515_000769 [Penicillium bovifimosum]
MKVLSLAMAFVFAALAAAGPVDQSSGNKVAERQGIEDFEHTALTGLDVNSSLTGMDVNSLAKWVEREKFGDIEDFEHTALTGLDVDSPLTGLDVDTLTSMGVNRIMMDVNRISRVSDDPWLKSDDFEHTALTGMDVNSPAPLTGLDVDKLTEMDVNSSADSKVRLVRLPSAMLTKVYSLRSVQLLIPSVAWTLPLIYLFPPW